MKGDQLNCGIVSVSLRRRPTLRAMLFAVAFSCSARKSRYAFWTRLSEPALFTRPCLKRRPVCQQPPGLKSILIMEFLPLNCGVNQDYNSRSTSAAASSTIPTAPTIPNTSCASSARSSPSPSKPSKSSPPSPPSIFRLKLSSPAGCPIQAPLGWDPQPRLSTNIGPLNSPVENSPTNSNKATNNQIHPKIPLAPPCYNGSSWENEKGCNVWRQTTRKPRSLRSLKPFTKTILQVTPLFKVTWRNSPPLRQTKQSTCQQDPRGRGRGYHEDEAGCLRFASEMWVCCRGIWRKTQKTYEVNA